MAGQRLAWKLGARLMVSMEPHKEGAKGPSGPPQRTCPTSKTQQDSAAVPPEFLGVALGTTIAQLPSVIELPELSVCVSRKAVSLVSLTVDVAENTRKNSQMRGLPKTRIKSGPTLPPANSSRGESCITLCFGG